METYFHVTGSLLESGSIIKPGSYGILLNERYGKENLKFGNPLSYYYEKELEEYRIKAHLDKPSRYNCVFLCHSKQNLFNFINYAGRVGQFGYEVKIIGNVVNRHIGDWKKYDSSWQNQAQWKTIMQDSVVNYWKGIDAQLQDLNANIEILVNNNIEIINRVY